MGYQIAYGSEAERKPDSGHSFLRVGMLAGIFFLLFCLMVCLCWPSGREALGHLIFPGGGRETMEAAEVFVQELRNGEPIVDALEHFCLELLNHGNLP